MHPLIVLQHSSLPPPVTASSFLPVKAFLLSLTHTFLPSVSRCPGIEKGEGGHGEHSPLGTVFNLNILIYCFHLCVTDSCALSPPTPGRYLSPLLSENSTDVPFPSSWLTQLPPPILFFLAIHSFPHSLSSHRPLPLSRLSRPATTRRRDASQAGSLAAPFSSSTVHCRRSDPSTKNRGGLAPISLTCPSSTLTPRPCRHVGVPRHEVKVCTILLVTDIKGCVVCTILLPTNTFI